MIVTETTRSSFRIPNLYRENQTLDILIHTHTHIYIYIYISKGLKMFSTVCTVTKRDMNFDTALPNNTKKS